MEAQTLSIEYHSDTAELTDALKAKTEERLAKLTKRRRDITGAIVTVNTASGDTQPREYRVHVTIHQRPENASAVEKGETVAGALSGALDAAERQVRERRARRRDAARRT